MSEYRVVCMQRTGSTFLTNYMQKFYNVKSEFEFLLDSHVLHNDGTLTYDKSLRYTGASLDRVLKKLDYLDETKLSELNFQLKIIPNSTMELGIENRLTNYLKGYKILTIARNPWDSFMSIQYQKETNWEYAHNVHQGIEPRKIHYTIKEKDIIRYAINWWYDVKFISNLEPHVFDYEDLSAESLNEFFGKQVKPDHWPLGIDYKELILNYDEAYTIFNKHFAGWESALYIMGSNRNEVMG